MNTILDESLRLVEASVLQGEDFDLDDQNLPTSKAELAALHFAVCRLINHAKGLEAELNSQLLGMVAASGL